MPTAARRPCWHSGCPNYQPCTNHGAVKVNRDWTRRYDKTRGTASQRGYTSRWARYSKSYRQRNPKCCDPYNLHPKQVKPSEHVDHIHPVSGPSDPGFWNMKNHQPLCKSCHSYKTAIEDGGFGHSKSVAKPQS